MFDVWEISQELASGVERVDYWEVVRVILILSLLCTLSCLFP